MLSMTGFGAAKGALDKISLQVQIKSVNGRFFETRFRLPREYVSYENELRKLIATKISRGTVDIMINRAPNFASETGFDVSPQLDYAKAYVKAAERLSAELGLRNDLSVTGLMKVPEVLAQPITDELPLEEKKLLMNLAAQALTKCIEERAREGEATQKTLQDIGRDLRQRLKAVQNQSESIQQTLLEKLTERVKNLTQETTIDPQRLAQEVVLAVDRADIAEELNRASSHLDALDGILKEKGPVGKKLEFLNQELLREFNTMGSKTQTLSVTQEIIQAKTSIERLREQIQNIE
ncbi:MAG: YicC family protein [Oligoflexia bacterium]|nr:YicC family protein [Oligoflexia bacterium]